jgi:hypothetical protein
MGKDALNEISNIIATRSRRKGLSLASTTALTPFTLNISMSDADILGDQLA